MFRNVQPCSGHFRPIGPLQGLRENALARPEHAHAAQFRAVFRSMYQGQDGECQICSFTRLKLCDVPSIFAASDVLRGQFFKTFPFTVFGDVYVSALEVAYLQGSEFVTFPLMVLFGKDGI
jgi:hypothetical protein